MITRRIEMVEREERRMRTQGPWKADEGLNITRIWGRGKHALDYPVAECHRNGGFDDDTHNENAHLIAAAPDLLDASQNLVSWLNDTGLTNKSRRIRVPAKLLEGLESAIAQAKGSAS